MTNAFILYDSVWKVQKMHAANREGSFKFVLEIQGISVEFLINYTFTWSTWYVTNITSF